MVKNERVLREELGKVNRFWLTGKVEEAEDYPIDRDEVEAIFDDAELKKISIVTGPRRSGKSVLLKHMIARLIREGVGPKNIIYYSLEDPYLKICCDNPIRDALDYWLENIAGEGRKYVFFDEIHFVDEWYKWIKVAYDRHRDVKLFISGSSSLILQREANKYLRGRYVLHEIWPLSFRQFLKLKGEKVEKLSLKPLAVDKVLLKHRKDFKTYLTVGGFPEFLETEDLEKWFAVLKGSVSNKAIYEDIATTFKIRNVKIMEQIFAFIVANQSRILSYEKINEVAGLKHEILLNYLEYLKSSYLIIEILKLAKNLKAQLKAKKKFLCVDQGLRNAMLKDYEVTVDNEGFLVENVVGVHCYVEALKKDRKLMYQRTNGETDFVLKGEGLTLLEVKYRNNILQKDIKKVRSMMKKAGCDNAYIITKKDFKVIEEQGKSITMVPALVFCLFIEDFIK